MNYIDLICQEALRRFHIYGSVCREYTYGDSIISNADRYHIDNDRLSGVYYDILFSTVDKIDDLIKSFLSLTGYDKPYEHIVSALEKENVDIKLEYEAWIDSGGMIHTFYRDCLRRKLPDLPIVLDVDCHKITNEWIRDNFITNTFIVDTSYILNPYIPCWVGDAKFDKVEIYDDNGYIVYVDKREEKLDVLLSYTLMGKYSTICLKVDIRDGVARVYDDMQYFVCDKCGKLEKRYMKETVEGEKYCSDCFEEFAQSDEYERYEMCAQCGEWHLKREMTEINGDHYCPDCIEEDWVKCEDCGEWTKRDEAYYIDDGDYYVCEDCYEDNYFTCEYCGRVHHTDDSIRAEDTEEWYCRDCAEAHWYHCSDCGRWYTHELDSVYNGDYVCQSCIERGDYVYCEHCGVAVRCNDAIEDNNGNYYCPDCDDYCERTVRSYHSNPERVFHELNDENPEFYIGAEIETENGDLDDRIEITKRHGNNEEYIYQMHDGSLNDDGIENILQPMSKGFFDNFDFESWMKDLVEAGARSHDTDNCGLHIHLSRTILGVERGSDEENFLVGKVLQFFSLNKKETERFARRSECRWAKFKIAVHKEGDDKEKKIENIKYLVSEQSGCHSDRYMALNNTNKNTIEFRIFRGTLNPATFRASVEFAIRVIEFVKFVGDEVEGLTWEKFCTFKPLPKVMTDYMDKRQLKYNYEETSVAEAV